MVSDGNSVEKSFRIKQDDKFFSRLMSKETSMANSSSRVFYYGESSVAAVPFVWEELPGTPKHSLSETSLLPPLTPPPSYYSKSNHNRRRIIRRNSSLSKSHNMFSCIFPIRFVEKSKKKTHILTSSSSSLSSPSSSPSSSSSSSSSSSWSLVYPSTSNSSCSIKDQGSLSFSEYSRSNNDEDDGSFSKHKGSKGFIRGCYLFRRSIN
ncbi:uncharacterized serine-rich protein C215.13 [Arachis duranensis]|uniref:Uncharacterized serine-rich protein C215.13 n=1 Tax=Arachis duranensis TaxID=130453 RepID=A0A6P4E0M6_ARADU|nr:uncharacterized serine-rich protein C215.13 [Arachis duranensis]